MPISKPILALALIVAIGAPHGAALAKPAMRGQTATTIVASRDIIKRQMEGNWTGTFRRYDAEGKLVETLPSRIEVRFDTADGADFSQTNFLRQADGTTQRIETKGSWDGDRIHLTSARINGWYSPLTFDASRLDSVLLMKFLDGSGLTVSEIITLSPDGQSRMRAAQYVIDGKIVRRTLIDEQRQPATAAGATRP